MNLAKYTRIDYAKVTRSGRALCFKCAEKRAEFERACPDPEIDRITRDSEADKMTIFDLKKELIDLRKELTERQTQKALSENTGRTLQAQLTTAERRIASQATELLDLRSELRESQSRKALSENAERTLQTQLTTAESRIATQATELSTWQNEYRTLVANDARRQGLFETLNHKMEEEMRKNESQASKLNTQAEEIDAQTRKIDAQAREINQFKDMSNHHAQIASELADLKLKYNDLVANNSRQQVRFEHSELELQTMRDSYQALDAQHKSVVTEKHRLIEQLEQARLESDERYADISQRLEQTVADRDECLQQVGRLRVKLDQAQSVVDLALDSTERHNAITAALKQQLAFANVRISNLIDKSVESRKAIIELNSTLAAQEEQLREARTIGDLERQVTDLAKNVAQYPRDAAEESTNMARGIETDKIINVVTEGFAKLSASIARWYDEQAAAQSKVQADLAHIRSLLDAHPRNHPLKEIATRGIAAVELGVQEVIQNLCIAHDEQKIDGPAKKANRKALEGAKKLGKDVSVLKVRLEVLMGSK